MAGKRQSVLDIALQCGGSAEACWEIAVRNGCSLTSQVEGQQLELPPVPIDGDTVAELAADGVRPACDVPDGNGRKPVGTFVIGIDMI